MKNISKDIVPYRIRQARLSRCLSIAELSELLGVSKQAVSQYELGKSIPSMPTLVQMSRYLKYPMDFFVKPLPENFTSSSPIFFRSKKTTPSKAKNAAKEKIEIFREIDDYFRNFVDFPKVNFPKIDYVESIEPLENDLIETYAMKLREHWNLGKGPIDNLMYVVQKNGVMVSKMFLGQRKIDAFSVWYNRVPYVFLSSDKRTNVRTRFDIAHELGHLLMHSDNYTEEDLNKKIIYDKLENEADRFAGAFLMPEVTFSKDVYSSSIDHFVELKKKWKTSIGSMIYRCESLGLLTDNQIKYLKDQMTTRVYWRREPLDNTMPVEQPFAHKQAVNLLLENNVLTPYDITDNIACSPEEIEEYCFLEHGTLENKECKKDNFVVLK